jgi:hypothetical protein
MIKEVKKKAVYIHKLLYGQKFGMKINLFLEGWYLCENRNDLLTGLHVLPISNEQVIE